MMTATAISFVGVIGFIGLVAPHVARMLLGEDQRFFLPGAMLVGAAFLSLSSVLSKVIIPGALFPSGDRHLVYWGTFLLLDYFK